MESMKKCVPVEQRNIIVLSIQLFESLLFSSRLKFYLLQEAFTRFHLLVYMNCSLSVLFNLTHCCYYFKSLTQ